ncbi:hypothetical protein LUZ60_009941 [Juncus effusus]|nr:hypothetical protein LUZ60_009941 [Juncus effusus]
MAKDSKKLALLVGFLLLPLIYALILRCNAGSILIWRFQLREPLRNMDDDLKIRRKEDGEIETDFRSFLLNRLAKGKAQEELRQNGIACLQNPDSDICITTASISIPISTTTTNTVYLTGNQKLRQNDDIITLYPYPARKQDLVAMERTSPVRLIADSASPSCDVMHRVPAVIFSTGGFAGNFFHDINDLLIPLFLTTSLLKSKVRLVLTDYQPWWVHKYQNFVSQISDYDVIPVPAYAGQEKVHCFPGAIIGLNYHGHLSINQSKAPTNLSIVDFRNFLHNSLFSNSHKLSTTTNSNERPLMVLISRRNSRTLLNEKELINLAEEIGFEVEIATPKKMSNMESFSKLLYTCRVLIGVHGAGLTNMVFLPPGAVLIQVVPWGLNWVSKAYYGKPAREMGFEYLEYKVEVRESSLSEKYSMDDQVIKDPLSMHLKGYHISKPIYIDGQNLRLNLTRFRGTLEKALDLA